MQVKANIKIGGSTFSVEPGEGKFRDQMFEVAEIINTLEQTPTTCSLCKGTDIGWMAMKTKGKGFKYIKRICNKCGATATMGERQEDGMLYWRRDSVTGAIWEPKYEGK